MLYFPYPVCVHKQTNEKQSKQNELNLNSNFVLREKNEEKSFHSLQNDFLLGNGNTTPRNTC